MVDAIGEQQRNKGLQLKEKEPLKQGKLVEEESMQKGGDGIRECKGKKTFEQQKKETREIEVSFWCI